MAASGDTVAIASTALAVVLDVKRAELISASFSSEEGAVELIHYIQDADTIAGGVWRGGGALDAAAGCAQGAPTFRLPFPVPVQRCTCFPLLGGIGMESARGRGWRGR
jgi:hypothetical protein